MFSAIIGVAGALWPILTGLLGGGTAALTAISMVEWIKLIGAVGAAVLAADPKLLKEAEAHLTKLLDELKLPMHEVAHSLETQGPQVAAQLIIRHIAKVNGDLAIKQADQSNKDY